MSAPESARSNKATTSAGPRGASAGPRGQQQSQHGLDNEEQPSQPVTRRRAVAAETYTPDEKTEFVKIPKSDAQRTMLEEQLEGLLIMKNLEKEELNHIVDAMFQKKVSKGEYVIKQGDEGDYFYVIEKGLFAAYVSQGGKDTLTKKYENTGSFGELALLYSIPRSASVVAESDGIIWALDRKTFRMICASVSHKNRVMYKQCIKSVKVLSFLNDYQRLQLADALIPKKFKAGQVVLKEGDEPDGMYFVVSGTLVVEKDVNGKKTALKSIEKGAYFGELALITNAKRAATVTAKTEVKAAFLDTDAFVRLLGPCQESMKLNIAKYALDKPI